jgi:hypothetical protein
MGQGYGQYTVGMPGIELQESLFKWKIRIEEIVCVMPTY